MGKITETFWCLDFDDLILKRLKPYLTVFSLMTTTVTKSKNFKNLQAAINMLNRNTLMSKLASGSNWLVLLGVNVMFPKSYACVLLFLIILPS